MPVKHAPRVAAYADTLTREVTPSKLTPGMARCSVCGCTVSSEHIPNGAICVELKAERAARADDVRANW